MTTYSIYATNFRTRRRELLAKSNKCMRCGVENRSIAVNAYGEIYIIYLHAAHVFSEQKMQDDAYLILLCPRCHRKFDVPAKKPPESIEDWKFIGEVAAFFIAQESKLLAQQEVQV